MEQEQASPVSDNEIRHPEHSAPVQTAQPSELSFYRPELDALRFAAFLMVFLFHIFPASPAQYRFVSSPFLKDVFASMSCAMAFGVCLFFILSAFLITTLLLRERKLTSTINLAAFYRRRVLRIWPLYFFALAAAFTVTSIVLSPPDYRLVAAYLLMSGNLLSRFHISGDVRPLKIFHLWSISIEEQFYCVFPMVARALDIRLLPVLSGFIGISALIALVYLSASHASKEEIWQNSFVQFLMFAAGIMIATHFARRPYPKFSNVTRLLLIVSGLASCFAAQYFCRLGGEGMGVTVAHALIGYLLVMLGCSAFLLSALGCSIAMPKALLYLGKISYGLYVFHIWCLSLSAFLVASILHTSIAEGRASNTVVLGKDVLAMALTIACAAISYSLLEKPFIAMKKRFEIVSTVSV
jgi:peptidoglycan/LPS O-acetylase OafA/YrhL